MSLKQKGLKYWLPYYLWQKTSLKTQIKKSEPVHILVAVVDHFEPFHGLVDLARAKERVKQWVINYPQIAEKHIDSDGKPLQHTWFYPPHLDHRFLEDLVGLCAKGYGEVEMHLHHNHMMPFPDTSDTLLTKVTQCIEDYSKYGIFCLPDGEKRFAFVHGDWSLNNSLGDQICGVNDEIRILNECGCYADFTFPSLGKAQPSMVNAIYYTDDSIMTPKSYNRGIKVEVGKLPGSNAFMLIQGIIGLRFDRRKRFKFAIESSDLSFTNLPSRERVDYWVKNAVTVKGQPNWKFIKLHTHGSIEPNMDANLGPSADQAFGYLENEYNDGSRYILHYVTAREMYNIIKAAENREPENPDNYRDYKISRYTYLRQPR